MKLFRIDHTGLYVSDLERSTAFFRDTIGLRYGGTGDDGQVFFHIGETMLALFTLPEGVTLEKHTLSLQHFAFAVDDVDAAYAELKAKGVPFDFPPTNLPDTGYLPHQRYTYFRDPDGAFIELVQRDR